MRLVEEANTEFFLRKSRLPEDHTAENIIFEEISILSARSGLTSLTDMVTGVTMRVKTLCTL